MNVTMYKVEDTPVAVIDDYYNEEELDLIWKELQYYDLDKYFLPEETHSALDEFKTLLKKNKTIMLDEVYRNRQMSNILTVNRKLFTEAANLLSEKHILFTHLQRINVDSTLISYYENSDYYKAHTDSGIFTCVSWLYREPKSFVGGDMIVCGKLNVECKNNRTIVFPSILPHEVTEIEMTEEKTGWGRYALVQLTTETLIQLFM